MTKSGLIRNDGDRRLAPQITAPQSLFNRKPCPWGALLMRLYPSAEGGG